MTVREHYDNHLANFYSWMIGDFEKAKNSFRDFCIKNGIKPIKTGNAIDLGAGNGIQSIALGEIGFNVKAVDFNEKLLSELKIKIGNLPIELIADDIRNVKADYVINKVKTVGFSVSENESINGMIHLILKK